VVFIIDAVTAVTDKRHWNDAGIPELPRFEGTPRHGARNGRGVRRNLKAAWIALFGRSGADKYCGKDAPML